MSISFKYKIAFFHGEVFYFNVDIKMLELLPFRYTQHQRHRLIGGHSGFWFFTNKSIVYQLQKNLESTCHLRVKIDCLSATKEFRIYLSLEGNRTSICYTSTDGQL
jgi:hypothetical protein